jgi:hypothetical protein
MKNFKLLFALLIACSITNAQSTLTPTQVNVFKNGTYFIVKEGTVYPKLSKISLNVPAAPLLGTYWITTTKDVSISKITFTTDTLKSLSTAQYLTDVVAANKGKKIKVNYKSDDKTVKEISGTLMDYFKYSGLMKIKTTDLKTYYINSSTISDFAVEETTNDKTSNDSLVRLAKVEFSKSLESTSIKLMYMQTGIQWVPSYNVKLISDKELQLEMKALVETTAEDLDNCDLTLTVGNPQFFYGYTIDPIAYQYQTNVSSLYPQSATSGFANTNKVMAQTNSYQAYDYNQADYTVNVTDAVGGTTADYSDYGTYSTDGEKTNDLYMYKLGKVTMKKGTKTSFQVFSYNIPYKDVYDVDIYDVVNYSYNSYIGNDPEQKFNVYHSLKLTNTSVNPFTTAPVFVMDEDLQPLAQDQLKYTPVSSTVSIQLSRASDVIVKNSEEEGDKTDVTKKYGRETYMKVTIKGSVIVQNLQDKKITISVDKSLTADVTKVSDSGTIKKTGKYYGLNPYTEVNWEVSLAANEKKTITYDYDVWVRSK